MTERRTTAGPVPDEDTGPLDDTGPIDEDTGAVDERERSARQIAASKLMAAGTLVSRILGFVRAMLLAVALGNGTRQAEMFTLSNTLPNMIYVLLAGGVLNTVFVPQIVRAIKNHSDGGEAYTNRVLTVMLSILAAITVVATVAAPLVVSVYLDPQWLGPRFAPFFDNIVMLGYLCIPQLFFYGVYVLVGQVLNAHEKFGPMMWAPIVNNLVSVLIFGVYLLVWGTDTDPQTPFTLNQMLVLGLGATLGIALQSVVLIPFLRQIGFRFRPRFDLRGAGLGRLFGLAKWTLFFVLVTQLGLIVVTRLASGATLGGGGGAGYNVYDKGYLLWILPHSLITVSLTTAMLSSASARAAVGDLRGVAAEAMRTMRLAITALVPVSIAFVALGLPLAQLLFGNGQGERDAPFIGWTLMALAVGLVPFTLNYVVQRTFYALEDTRTPFFQQCIVVALNVGFALALVLPFSAPRWIAPGLGLAYSLAYAIGFAIAFPWLKRRIPGLDGAPLVRLATRLTIAVAPGAVFAYVVCTILLRETSQPIRAAALAGCGVVAVGAFIGLARLLRIGEVTDLISTVRRRGNTPANGTGDDPGDGPGDGPSGGGAPGGGPTDSPAGGGLSGPVPAPTAGSRPRVGTVPATGNGPASVTVGVGTTAPATDAAGGGEAMTVNTDPGSRRGTAVPTAPPRDADHPSATSPATPGDPDSLTDTVADEASLATVQRPPAPSDSADSASSPRSPGSADRSGVLSGTVLGGRYRLEERMEARHGVTTWRAFDETLSRSVVIHLLPGGDERSPEVLSSARKAAIATDSRFLRILDAVHSVDPDQGSYVVCEYSPGQNLTTLLATGPLSALEAAWVVREVADAMSGVHSVGLHHQRISPDTVWITPTGNVKIGDMAIRAELRPTPDPDPSDASTNKRGRTAFHPATDEANDVADLGRLLYGCLVHRWPGGHRYGLEAAPTNGADGWLTPRQVRHGVSPALDRICEQVLTAEPRQGEPLRTANDIVNALTRVLGSADASADLERRLQHPVPPVMPEDGHPVETTDSPLTVYRAQAEADRLPASPASPAGAVPAPAEPPRAQRRWLLVAILVLVAILLIALIAVVTQLRGPTAGNGTTPSTSTSVPAAPQVRPISGGVDFDPQGGDQTENADAVPQAFDGDPETGWTTDRYRGSAAFGGIDKDGVGVVVDLGAPVPVSSVKLIMAQEGSDLEVLVPTADPQELDEAPRDDLEAWRSVGEATRTPTELTLDLTEPVTTRYVLVMVTTLAPAEDNTFQSGINEIEVSG